MASLTGTVEGGNQERGLEVDLRVFDGEYVPPDVPREHGAFAMIEFRALGGHLAHRGVRLGDRRPRHRPAASLGRAARNVFAGVELGYGFRTRGTARADWLEG